MPGAGGAGRGRARARRGRAVGRSGALALVGLAGLAGLATGDFQGAILGNVRRLDVKKGESDRSTVLGLNPHILLGEDESSLHSLRQIGERKRPRQLPRPNSCPPPNPAPAARPLNLCALVIRPAAA